MIYIHIPFCHRKCTYCAFYSLGNQAADIQYCYVDALLHEMQQRRAEQNHPIRTVYFGGGTPSMLPVAELGRLTDGLRRCFDLSHVEEATIECNPEDLDADYLQSLAELHFFNRISIGIQSFDDDMLHLLGRRHNVQQALHSVEMSHAAGFHNISIDLMYGLPTTGEKDDVQAIESQLHHHLPLFDSVSHVSAYALTVEPGTALEVQIRRGTVVLPDEDNVVKQYHVVRQFLDSKGFVQYEVSNYARSGFHSRHNSRYWDRTPYLGLGASAHSFDGRCRRWNDSNLKNYIATQPFEEEVLTENDACNEMIMTALRTVSGLSLASIPAIFRQRVATAAQRFVACGWLMDEQGVLRPTAEGLLHADGMAAELFV